MANPHPKCLTCKVRHSPKNCEFLSNAYEEVEPQFKKRSYEQKKHPLSQNPQMVTSLYFYAGWTIISLILAIIMIAIMVLL